MKDKQRKSPLVIIEFIIIGILILAIAFMLTIYFSFRNTDSIPKVFGYYIYHTHAVNMETRIPAESAVFAKESEIDNIAVNSVVLCKIDDSVTLIRVVEILDEDDGTYYIVRYDTSPQNETYKVPKESVVAKAVSYDVFTGKLLNFATSKKGIILVVIIPSILIVLYQIIKIVLSKPDDDDEDDDKYSEPDGGKYAALKTKAEAMDDGESDVRPAPAVRAKFDTAAPQKKESVISVDSSGKAEYSPKTKADSVLITGDRLDAMSGRKPEHSAPVVTGFANEPVKIPDEKPEEENGALIGGAAGDTSSFAPKVSDVIPESIAAIKTPASAEPETVKPAEKPAVKLKKEDAPVIVEAPKEYFTKADTALKADILPEEKNHPVVATNSIPEKAVVPRETIAPKRKKSASPTVDELMSIIDAEQAKINRNK